MAKVGVPEAFTAAGYPVTYVPNRVPVLPEVTRVDLGPGLHIGVFAEPFWRKNVVTQLLAVGLLDGAVAHVMRRPEVSYLDQLSVVEHGELPWDRFVAVQGSVDLNLYVTLSECHPSTPQESYLAGVPCLLSRVSGVFADDPRLWEITTTDRADDPSAIADAARRLLLAKDEAVSRAGEWMKGHDRRAVEIWAAVHDPFRRVTDFSVPIDGPSYAFVQIDSGRIRVSPACRSKRLDRAARPVSRGRRPG